VDVRIIAATNRNLSERVESGLFRKDLFYRLNVLPIPLPPLRQREGDIPLLVFSMLEENRKTLNKKILRVSPEVMKLFTQYDWPGNVRELKSTLEYAAIISDAEWIEMRHLPKHHQDVFLKLASRNGSGRVANRTLDEKQQLIDALRTVGGNQMQAAKILGVHRMTVWNRMRKYGITSRKVLQTGD